MIKNYKKIQSYSLDTFYRMTVGNGSIGKLIIVGQKWCCKSYELRVREVSPLKEADLHLWED